MILPSVLSQFLQNFITCKSGRILGPTFGNYTPAQSDA
jgi:hypothetical protein